MKKNPRADESSRACRRLAARLRAWRKDNGVRLAGLAKGLGLSISAVGAWETTMRFPSGEHLDRLSRLTGIPVCGLLYFRDGCCPLCEGTGAGKRVAKPR